MTTSADDKRISALTDSGTYVSTDYMVLDRNSASNVKLSQTNLFAATTPDAMATCDKTRFGTAVADLTALHALDTSGYIVGAQRLVLNLATDYFWNGTLWGPVGDGNSGSFDPFDAKITGNGQLEAATAAGKKVFNIANSITIQNGFQMLNDCFWYVAAGVSITSVDKSVDTNGHFLTIAGANTLDSQILYTSTVSGNDFIINTVGSAAVLYLTGSDFSFINTDTAVTNATLCKAVGMKLTRVLCLPGVADNTGLNFSQPASSFDSIQIAPISSASTNFLVMAYGRGNNLILNNSTVTGSAVAIGTNAIVDKVIANGGVNNITNSGYMSAVTNGSGTINITAGSDKAQVEGGVFSNFTTAHVDTALIGVNLLGNLLISAGADRTRIVACHGGGTYTDGGTNTEVSGNTGSIPNGSGDFTAISLIYGSPVNAIVDGAGSVPGSYTSITASQAASRVRNIVNAIVTQTTPVTIPAAEGMSIDVNDGSSIAFSDAAYFDGAAGATSVSFIMKDQTAQFQYATIANPVFKSFDVNSSIVLQGGNIFNNTSATDNSYITGLGTIDISDSNFYLPNFTNGGVKTTSKYSAMNNVLFWGGGASCEYAYEAGGGNISNIILDQQYVTAGNLNKATADTNVSNVLIDNPQDALFNIKGNLTGLLSLSDNTTLVPVSGSRIVATKATNIVLGTGVSDVEIIGGYFTGIVSFANDNSNSNIKFSGSTFGGAVDTFGTDIVYSAVYFASEVGTEAGSTGSFVGCRSAVAMTFNAGVFSKAGNDDNIGNNPDPISSFPDGVTFQSGDVFPIERGGSNYKISQTELLTASNSGSMDTCDSTRIHIAVADLTALNALVTTGYTAGVTCMVNSENALYRWNGTIWVETGTSSSGSFDPFNAKVTANGQLESGITAGKNYINLAASITLQSNIQLQSGTTLFIANGVTITDGGYRIDVNDFPLTIVGASLNTCFIHSNQAANDLSMIYNSGSGTPSITMQEFDFQNSSTHNNTPICSSALPQIIENLRASPGSGTNAGINLSANECSFYNLTIYGGSSSSVAGLVADHCYGSNLFLNTSATGSIVAVGSASKINGITNVLGTNRVTNSGKIINATVIAGSLDIVTGANSAIISDSTVSTYTVDDDNCVVSNVNALASLTLNPGVNYTFLSGIETPSFVNSGAFTRFVGNINIPNYQPDVIYASTPEAFTYTDINAGTTILYALPAPFQYRIMGFTFRVPTPVTGSTSIALGSASDNSSVVSVGVGTLTLNGCFNETTTGMTLGTSFQDLLLGAGEVLKITATGTALTGNLKLVVYYRIEGG